MDNRIIELLYRNLHEVFREGDAARRRAAIQDLYTEDCVLYVPPGVFVGHDALDKFAGVLRAIHSHFVYTPHGEPQALHNAGILAWGSGPKGEAPDYTGLDVVISPRRQDCCALRLSQSQIFIASAATFISARRGHVCMRRHDRSRR
jgi:hypothetical protein